MTRALVVAGVMTTAALAVGDEPLFPGSGKAPIPTGDAPPGTGGLTARACNACHAEIYDEWKRSMHSLSWADSQFQEVWRSQKSPPECLNCHTPLAAQQPFAGARANPGFSPTLQGEGVTCAACHVRGGAVVGRGTSKTRPPHPVSAASEIGRAELCAGCHQLELPGREKGLYDTYREWAGTEFARRGVTCQDCHLPIRTGNVATGIHRPYRSHDFRGAHSDVLLQRALAVDVSLEKPLYEAGEEVVATVVVRNVGAGHHVPSGDPLHEVHVVVGLADSRGEFLDKVETVFARKIGRTPPWEETADTRLAAGETRRIAFRTRFPGGAGEHYLVVQLAYHLMPPAQATALGIPADVTSRVFDSQIVPIADPGAPSGSGEGSP